MCIANYNNGLVVVAKWTSINIQYQLQIQSTLVIDVFTSPVNWQTFPTFFFLSMLFYFVFEYPDLTDNSSMYAQ